MAAPLVRPAAAALAGVGADVGRMEVGGQVSRREAGIELARREVAGGVVAVVAVAAGHRVRGGVEVVRAAGSRPVVVRPVEPAIGVRALTSVLDEPVEVAGLVHRRLEIVTAARAGLVPAIRVASAAEVLAGPVVVVPVVRVFPAIDLAAAVGLVPAVVLIPLEVIAPAGGGRPGGAAADGAAAGGGRAGGARSLILGGRAGLVEDPEVDPPYLDGRVEREAG